ncbi:TetR/AcrR family transcriptional regulator [Paenibacillus durus]|uniref:TetR family transcriptional regulator n=1 Tax=Paenibacillus durus TaxID=44251 RepID=A0A089HSV1_PAEDU|nr:TetR/AcrR family transcriptional regulator [Paenibacillus durus]AIQ13393.1 TetR family transcriptional regulator [Paenibacillus durus]
MAEKLDRRQVRTKQLLHKALMELMREKKADGITVTDIANRASINRGTFYLHYRDVPDMLEQMKDDVFEQIKVIVTQLDFNELSQCAEKDEPYPLSVRIFEEFSRHAEFLTIMFGTNGDLSYVNRYKNFLTEQIYDKFTYLQPQEEKMHIPRDYLIAYISSANFGILLHWLESGMKQTPQQMGMIMAQIITYGPIISSGLRGK